MMEDKRPGGAVILAILAVVGALTAAYHALQLLGVVAIPALGGQVDLGLVGLLGAITWGALALFYLMTAFLVWIMEPRGIVIMAVLSVTNLVIAGLLLLLTAISLQAMLPGLLVNGLILIICLLPDVRRAFDIN